MSKDGRPQGPPLHFTTTPAPTRGKRLDKGGPDLLRTERSETAGRPEDDGTSKLSPLRLGVLLSGSGSNLQALIDAVESHELPGVEIVLVVSNNIDAYGLERARRHHLQAMYLPWRDRAESEAKLITWLQLFQVDLVVLAGWMRILSTSFLAQFPRHVINIHPALLPDDGTGSTYTTSEGTVIPVFRGMHAVRQALEAGVKITGSSIHFVTPQVDAGPVICREEVVIQEGDSEESLHERLKVVEHRLIVEAVRKLKEIFYGETCFSRGGSPARKGDSSSGGVQ